MSGKRRASTELNHDNWNQEEEPQEVGVFEKAPDEILQKRVIKTAKRRFTSNSNADGDSKSIFSGFGGFTTNSKPKSFSFLSNAKSTTSSDELDGKKPTFSFLSNSNKNSGDASSTPGFSFLSNTKPINDSNAEKKKSPVLLLPNKMPFSVTDKPVANEVTNSASQTKLNDLSKNLKKNDEKQSNKDTSINNDTEGKNPDEVFLQKIRSLNLLCAEWIIKHLNENLSYILTPVFDDYKKYLDQLKEERQSKNVSSTKKVKLETPEPTAPSTSSSPLFKAPDFKDSLSKIKFDNSFFAKPPEKQDQPQFKFGIGDNLLQSTKMKSEPDNKPLSTQTFTFGANSPSKSITENKTEDKPKPFTFGFNSSEAASQLKSPFDTANQFKNPFTDSDNQLKNPFADTSGQKNPFFSTNSLPPPKPSEGTTEDTEDQPPVKEDVAITEEGSVYDKKCKVFIKKDGNFVDHGVGFLFLKLVGDDKKCQVIVRANNKLASIIINVLLTSNIPLEKKGKNNVMIVCCPTPDAKPSVVLLKVKTEEDADQLLEMMNKHKK